MTETIDWRATVSYLHESSPISDDAADALVAALPGYAIAAHDGHQLHLSMTIAASTLRKAVDEALRAASQAMRDAYNISNATPTGIRVITDIDHQREIAQPPAMELVGVSEIAELAGVSRQRAQQLTALEGFPRPVGEIKAGKVHTLASVKTWLAGWSRKPGWAGKHAAEAARK